MDYYASWPRSSVPKWVGVTLGGIFTLIVVVCAGMIVHLLRPPKRAPLPVAAVTAPQPKAAPTAPANAPAAPANAPAAPANAPAVVANAPTTAPTVANAPATAPAATPAPAVAAVKKHPAHPHKRAILAKHDGKAGRSAKSDLDRLLGL